MTGTVSVIRLAALYFAGVGAATQIAKVIPVLGYLTAQGLSVSQATLVMSAIGIAAIAFGAVAGQMVVDLGLWRVMAVASVVAVVAGLTLPLAQGFATLMLLRIVEGLSHIAIVAAAPTLMITLAPPARASLVMGIWASFFGVAFALTHVFALSGLNLSDPVAFLRWHVIYVIPALGFGLWHWQQDSTVMPLVRNWALVPRGLIRAQLLAALSFLFHAGVFTTMLVFAQMRIGGETGAFIAPLLPLISLAFVFVGSSLLAVAGSVPLFLTGAGVASIALLVALMWVPLEGYICAFAGVGLMQLGIFARIGEVCNTNQATSATNGAYTQLGNVGNVAIPYLASLSMSGSPSGLIDDNLEAVLLVVVACAVTLFWLSTTRTRHAI
ncbi:MAG: MFS transporter [Sphingomonadaceae bacterium]